jgi:hypothetical protein
MQVELMVQVILVLLAAVLVVLEQLVVPNLV